jgi:ABC-2 type transport system permease protein
MQTEPISATPSPGSVIASITAKRAGRSGAIWGYVFGVVVASSALSYASIYKTRAERDHLAFTFGANKAASALFGPAPQLQTVAGFTVFKSSMTLMLVGAVWGLLTSTKLLRGEEDAGRWELVLTGQTTRAQAAAQALAGLAAGAASLWAVTSVITVLAGRASSIKIAVGPALFLSLTLVTSAVMWLAIGALTSQLAPTRRQAAAYAAELLGLSYAVRMVADSGTGLHWLIWASPLGWVEELKPLTSPQPLLLLPIAAFTAALALTALRLARKRDLGASVLPDQATAAPHLALLSGPVGLTVRLVRPLLLGWALAIAVAGLMMGVVAKAAGQTISGSSVQQVFARLGAPGTGASAYLGVTFLLLATMLTFLAAGQVTAARSEEAEGHLDHLFARPVSRMAWFAARLLVALGALVGGGLVGAVFVWLGAASEHAGVGFSTLLDAGLNVVPPAICALGIGALAIGTWPRRSALAAYGVVTWSLLVEVIGGFGREGTMGRWLLDTSVFHQMTDAPAVAPSWEANAVMVAIGALGAGIGALSISRRDLQGE